MRPARRHLILAAGAGTLVPKSWAQSAGRVARVGWLAWAGDTAPDRSVPLTALRAGLARLGWREGHNLVIEARQGERDQGAALAGELVRAGIEVIVAQGVMIFPARAGAGQVPLVFAINGDPVEAGLVASLARPAGNLTGVTALSDDLAGKRLELLKTVRPALRRVAIVFNQLHPGFRIESEAARAAAAKLGIELAFHPLRAAAELEAALAAIAGAPAGDAPGALFAFPDTLINRLASKIAEFVQHERLPSISGWAEFACAGKLMSYGPGYAGFYAHLATYVDKILRGARPAELPVELPTRFALALNERTARTIRLPLPAALRARADELIA